MRRGAEAAPLRIITKLNHETWKLRNLEAPDQPGGTANFYFTGAQITSVDIVGLHTPGKILEAPNIQVQLSVHAAAKINGYRVIRIAAGHNPLETSHGVNKRPPVSVCLGEARAQKKVVLRDAGTVETAGIESDAKKRKSRQREVFGGGVPSPEVVFINDNLG